MSLYIASLNSGSNGNCYYIGNQREAVLVDAGLSCRETENRMQRLGLSFDKVRAVFISHEHTDHTGGVELISRRYQIPVFFSRVGYQNSRFNVEGNLFVGLKSYDPIAVGELTVTAFPKQHDANEPHSFIVAGGGITVGVFTDIGAPCTHVVQNFRLCHAAFLEANYDEIMLDEGRYPLFLKDRIRSDHGHLSNRQALDLFTMHRPSFMTHLLLSHLSRDNNSPQLVQDIFTKHANGVKIAVASRYKESSVYLIDGNPVEELPVRNEVRGDFPVQMTLF